MSLKTQIDADIKQAMLAKNQDDLRALRAIKSLILLAETEGGTKGELNEEQEMKLLTKAAKQRRDSADIFRKEARADLEKKEVDELAIIEKYLPKQMSEQELLAAVKSIIEKIGAKGPHDMGKVMGASKELAGKADGKAISEAVKKILSGN
jgi:uncharacterized protein YqeY